ncbi:hypothetical protein [Adonisia turfae]|uniref:Uncharacterized protein n=1 Tax=Adonisia turfae CCMR0081 TaxID=2292702 RepID=A0A6M0RGX5_9CYAN|nr:hypothetical protein [Adonisia turfae]NEZ54982.1 hypothetical protein [Adonisia turfae CCMR0081]
MKQNVTSREYKIMLQKDRFKDCLIGSQDNLLEKAREFWEDFKKIIQDIVIDTDGSLNKVKKEREIKFYDTADHDIRESNYVFRERVDLNTGKREVVLKYRHPDRYVSQDRDMTAADIDDGETKFEEDIKPPFLRLYSFSTKQPISKSKDLNKLNDLGKLYPDLKKQLKPYQKNEPIEVVGNFTAREIVITGADFQIRDNPKVEAKCALIAWYEVQGEEDKPVEDKPVIVEFSFRYKNEQEKYSGEASEKVYDVFDKLQKELTEWVDLKGSTKTAYVYSRAS